MKITANDPKRKSWLKVDKNSDFPIQNIPFGVFLTVDDITTIGSRIGNYVIDLSALNQLGYFEGIPLTDDIFMQDNLNDFIADGRMTWRLVRNRIADVFDKENPKLRDNKSHCEITRNMIRTVLSIIKLRKTDGVAESLHILRYSV